METDLLPTLMNISAECQKTCYSQAALVLSFYVFFNIVYPCNFNRNRSALFTQPKDEMVSAESPAKRKMEWGS